MTSSRSITFVTSDKVEPDGYVYIKVRKGMYGLPQASLLAQGLLADHLTKHGYK